MSKRTFVLKSVLPGLFLMAGGLFAAACTQSSSPDGGMIGDTFEISEGDESTFKGAGSMENLSAEERKQYTADQRYLWSLSRPGERIVLNHADPRQHRFVMARLKIAGKTPENSPALFQMIEETRAKQLAEQDSEGGAVQVLDAADGSRENMHYLGSTNINSAVAMEVIAAGSVKDTIYYGSIDAGVWDANGNQIGNLPYVETYTNMPYASVKTEGNLNLTTQQNLVGDSMMIEDNSVYGYRSTYVAALTTRGPTFGPVTVDAPKDTGTDGNILVCLERGGAGCDYSMLGMLQVRLPLVGQIPITSGNYTFDQTRINEYKNGTAKDQEGKLVDGAHIRVVLKNTGGGCSKLKETTFWTSAQGFWNTVTLSADQKTLFWNMPQNAPAIFSSSCQLIQDNVELNMAVRLPFKTTGGTGEQEITITNNLTADPTKRIPNIKMTNSCLAAGTMIEMGSGWQLPVEEIQMGDLVSSPYDRSDFSLQVADRILGTERSPMVRIEDEHGHSLLMTENHPIDVVGRGMVLAKYLKTGDKVTTKDGPSSLVKVSREQYSGTVYNFKVGSASEMQSLAKDQTTMYANGFLVGDAQIQGNYESAELSQGKNPTRLAARWREDYRQSAAR